MPIDRRISILRQFLDLVVSPVTSYDLFVFLSTTHFPCDEVGGNVSGVPVLIFLPALTVVVAF